MNAVLYRIYTETRDNLPELVARYFDGATLISALGLWQAKTIPHTADTCPGRPCGACCDHVETTGREDSTIVEIIGDDADLQRIVNLAGDIKHVNAQSCVLVTWSPVNRLDV